MSLIQFLRFNNLLDFLSLETFTLKKFVLLLGKKLSLGEKGQFLIKNNLI